METSSHMLKINYTFDKPQPKTQWEKDSCGRMVSYDKGEDKM
jgi:hypothetical protein